MSLLMRDLYDYFYHLQRCFKADLSFTNTWLAKSNLCKLLHICQQHCCHRYVHDKNCKLFLLFVLCIFTQSLINTHHTLSQVAAIRTGFCPPGRRWRTGCPRNWWLHQIVDGTPFGIRAELTRARNSGHTGTGLTQQTFAVYAI